MTLAKAHHTPLVFVGTGHDGAGADAPTTSRLFTATAGGALGPSYDKMILVPFTEYLPFAGLVPGLRDIFTLARHYQAGRRCRATRGDRQSKAHPCDLL